MVARAVLIAGVGVAALAGALIVSIALDHNPQGEFFDPVNGEFQLVHLAALFFAWFAVVFLPFLVIAGIVRLSRTRDKI